MSATSTATAQMKTTRTSCIGGNSATFGTISLSSAPARVAEVLPHLSLVDLVVDGVGDWHSKDNHKHDGARAAHYYQVPACVRIRPPAARLMKVATPRAYANVGNPTMCFDRRGREFTSNEKAPAEVRPGPSLDRGGSREDAMMRNA
jgi:hypothetical protein